MLLKSISPIKAYSSPAHHHLSPLTIDSHIAMLITYDLLPGVLTSLHFTAVKFNPVKSLKVNSFPDKPSPLDLPSIGLLSSRDTVAHVSTLPVDES